MNSNAVKLNDLGSLIEQSALRCNGIHAGPAANEALAGPNAKQWLFRVAAAITAAGVGVATMVALASTTMSPFGAFVALPAAFAALAAVGCWIDEKLAAPALKG